MSGPGWGRSPGEGNGKPLQYSCLGNPMDRGAWRSTVHGVAKSRTTELLNNSNNKSRSRGRHPHDLMAAEAPPPDTITPGVRASAYESRGTQTVSPLHMWAKPTQPVWALESHVVTVETMTAVLQLEEPLSDPTSFH